MVWEWIDDQGRPVYVGMGSGPNADRVFMRAMLKAGRVNNPLSEWLLSVDGLPERSTAIPSMLLHKVDAMNTLQARRENLRRKGVRLLSRRPHGTKAGGGSPKLVEGPDGTLYTSVREAARKTGVTPATISRKCNDPISDDWSFVL